MPNGAAPRIGPKLSAESKIGWVGKISSLDLLNSSEHPRICLILIAHLNSHPNSYLLRHNFLEATGDEEPSNAPAGVSKGRGRSSYYVALISSSSSSTHFDLLCQ